jgi:thioesterase domain-containing protein/acyl carrier protein
VELPTSFADRTFASTGVRLHYLFFANPGKPVLVGLHGFQETARSFFFLEPYLRANFELYLLDWRGHGESPPLSDGTYHIATLLYDLAVFDASVLPDSYFLIGHCLGADMAALWAALRRDRVRAAVLIEGLLTQDDRAATADQRRQIEQLQAWLKTLQFSMKTAAAARRPGMQDEQEVQRALAWMHPGLTDDQYGALARILTKRRGDDTMDWHYAPDFPTRWPPIPASMSWVRQLWRQIECPVLWLTGSIDRSEASAAALPAGRDTGAAAYDAIASHFRRFEHQPVAAPAKGIHNAQPGQVVEHLSAFFDRLGVHRTADAGAGAVPPTLASHPAQSAPPWSPSVAAFASDRAGASRAHARVPPDGDSGASARLPQPARGTATGQRLDSRSPDGRSSSLGRAHADDVAQHIRTAVARHLHVPQASIDLQTSFTSLGVDSLGLVKLMTVVQEVTSRPLALSHLTMFPTIAALAGYLGRDHNALAQTAQVRRHRAPASPGLMPLQTIKARCPLFFAGGVTGSVAALMPLAHSLSADQPFYAFQPPDRNAQAAPLECVEALAACFIDRILAVQPQGPFVLGGHSFGGLVAYEAAVQLQRQGARVARVIVADTALDIDFSNELDEVTARAELLGLAAAAHGIDETVRPEAFRRAAKEQQHAMLRHAMHMETAPQEAIEGVVELYRANRRALARYRPLPSRIPVTLLVATENTVQSLSNIVPLRRPTESAALGWEPVCAGEFDVIRVPGNHFSMLLPPHVDEVAARCRTYLAGHYIEMDRMPQ